MHTDKYAARAVYARRNRIGVVAHYLQMFGRNVVRDLNAFFHIGRKNQRTARRPANRQ